MSEPLVSVVMVVRDAEPYLEASVRSVLGQTLRSLELVVVDDGSVDGGPDTLARAAAADERLRVVRQEAEGLVSARNRAWSLARAPFVAVLDGDDVAHPTRLERQLAELRRRPALAVLGSRVREVDDAGIVRGEWATPSGPALVRWSLLFENVVPHSSAMLRRAAVGDEAPYSEDLDYAEDYDLWVRLAGRVEVDNLEATLVDRRVHARSRSARNACEQRCQAAEIARKARALIVGVELGRAEADALDVAVSPEPADPRALALLPDAVERLRSGYARRWQPSRKEAAAVRMDAARRTWRAAHLVAPERALLAARLRVDAVRIAAGVR
jgi:glycosyltransferase involved in cell wall biosynthesis